MRKRWKDRHNHLGQALGLVGPLLFSSALTSTPVSAVATSTESYLQQEGSYVELGLAIARDQSRIQTIASTLDARSRQDLLSYFQTINYQTVPTESDVRIGEIIASVTNEADREYLENLRALSQKARLRHDSMMAKAAKSGAKPMNAAQQTELENQLRAKGLYDDYVKARENNTLSDFVASHKSSLNGVDQSVVSGLSASVLDTSGSNLASRLAERSLSLGSDGGASATRDAIAAAAVADYAARSTTSAQANAPRPSSSGVDASTLFAQNKPKNYLSEDDIKAAAAANGGQLPEALAPAKDPKVASNAGAGSSFGPAPASAPVPASDAPSASASTNTDASSVGGGHSSATSVRTGNTQGASVSIPDSSTLFGGDAGSHSTSASTSPAPASTAPAAPPPAATPTASASDNNAVASAANQTLKSGVTALSDPPKAVPVSETTLKPLKTAADYTAAGYKYADSPASAFNSTESLFGPTTMSLLQLPPEPQPSLMSKSHAPFESQTFDLKSSRLAPVSTSLLDDKTPFSEQFQNSGLSTHVELSSNSDFSSMVDSEFKIPSPASYDAKIGEAKFGGIRNITASGSSNDDNSETGQRVATYLASNLCSDQQKMMLALGSNYMNALNELQRQYKMTTIWDAKSFDVVNNDDHMVREFALNQAKTKTAADFKMTEDQVLDCYARFAKIRHDSTANLNLANLMKRAEREFVGDHINHDSNKSDDSAFTSAIGNAITFDQLPECLGEQPLKPWRNQIAATWATLSAAIEAKLAAPDSGLLPRSCIQLKKDRANQSATEITKNLCYMDFVDISSKDYIGKMNYVSNGLVLQASEYSRVMQMRGLSAFGHTACPANPDLANKTVEMERSLRKQAASCGSPDAMALEQINRPSSLDEYQALRQWYAKKFVAVSSSVPNCAKVTSAGRTDQIKLIDYCRQDMRSWFAIQDMGRGLPQSALAVTAEPKIQNALNGINSSRKPASQAPECAGALSDYNFYLSLVLSTGSSIDPALEKYKNKYVDDGGAVHQIPQ